jgi:hypothetical protein
LRGAGITTTMLIIVGQMMEGYGIIIIMYGQYGSSGIQYKTIHRGNILFFHTGFIAIMFCYFKFYPTKDRIACKASAARESASFCVCPSAYTLITSSVPEGRTKQRPKGTFFINLLSSSCRV